jgi:alkyl hydroperoxide reductase subunit AhpC
VGISIDHKPALKAWSESIGGITYPLLSDFWPHGKIAQDYGVFRADGGMAERAIIIVDTAGIVRYIDVHDIKEQPDEEQIFEVLATLH